MRIDLVKVKSLGFGNKYCLMVNGIPVMIAGKHKAIAMKQVAERMEISEDIFLSKHEQGYIIATINSIV